MFYLGETYHCQDKAFVCTCPYSSCLCPKDILSKLVVTHSVAQQFVSVSKGSLPLAFSAFCLILIHHHRYFFKVFTSLYFQSPLKS